MALPNGVCKPFVDTIDLVQNPNSKIVDLSADYRLTQLVNGLMDYQN